MKASYGKFGSKWFHGSVCKELLPVLHRAHYFEESSVPCSSGAEWCKAALEGEGSASGAYVAPGSDLEC